MRSCTACISSRTPAPSATMTSVEAMPRLTIAAAIDARNRWLASAAARIRSRSAVAFTTPRQPMRSA